MTTTMSSLCSRRSTTLWRCAKCGKAIAIREAHALLLLLLLQNSVCSHLASLRLCSSLQVLDRYFGNVCELDLIFNFHKAYHILDELLITGELQEPSKKAILRVTAAQDALMEGSGDSKVSDSKYEI